MNVTSTFDERRINRRTAYTALCKLDAEKTTPTAIIPMMRELVRDLGPLGAMNVCKFQPHIPPAVLELQLLCCEYLAFEEGKPEEAELAAECERLQAIIAGATT